MAKAATKQRDGGVVFVSNTPTPYQLDMFNAVAKLAPTRAYFLRDIDAKQNVSWTLEKPTWLNILPKGNPFKKAAAVWNAYKGGPLPRVLLLGGYQAPCNVLLLAWAKLKGVPVYFWLENPQPHTGWKKIAQTVAYSLVLPWANGVLAIDSRAKTAYRKYNRHVEWLPYAITFARYQKPRVARKGPVRFLFIGQLIERKGIAELLEAFRQIDPQDGLLSIAGGGPLNDEVKAFCKETGHTMLGFVQPGDLPDVLAKHDVFVLPSHYDGWALVVAEAMAAGLPVISNHRVGAFADLVEDGSHGKAAVTGEDIREAAQGYIDDHASIGVHGRAARAKLASSRGIAETAAVFINNLNAK